MNLVVDCLSHCLLGNIFSTLRGIRFEWSLSKDTSAKNQKLEPEDILTYVDLH